MVAHLKVKDLLGVACLLSNAAASSDGVSLNPCQVWRFVEGLEGLPTETHKCFSKMVKDPEAHLTKLEHLLSLFRSLTSSLEEEISKEKKRITAATRHRGINAFPNEVLSMIIENVVTQYSDILALSRVCSRFRALVLVSSKLWARCKLNWSSPITEIRSIVRMSRGKPLIASLQPKFWNGEDLSVSERILNHQSLLEELHLNVTDDEAHPPFLNGLRLPLLRRLDFKLICTRYDQSTPHFHESWDMPQLRYLRTNFVPSHVLGRSITSFDFAYNSDSDTIHFTIDGLATFLRACPLLEHLGVEFLFISSQIYHEDGRPIVMRALRSLSVRASQPATLSMLGQFLERLVADDVTSLTLRLDELSQQFRGGNFFGKQEGYQEVEKWGPVIQARISRFSRLREVQMFIEEGKVDHSKFEAIWNFNSMLSKLPRSLETFSSVNPLHRLRLFWNNEGTRAGTPALTHFEIYDGKDITMRHVMLLKDWAVRGGPDPRVVRVGNCPLISEGELRSLLPEGAIEYF